MFTESESIIKCTSFDEAVYNTPMKFDNVRIQHFPVYPKIIFTQLPV